MATSHSALEFMMRHRLVNEISQPVSRLAVQDLLVHFLPLSAPKPPQSVLRCFEGTPPPDRGGARPWPHP